MSGSHASRSRVLIVDDDAMLRAVVAAALESDDVDTFEAESGERALVLCDEVSPELVILDIEMPGIGGYEACRQLRRRPDGHDRIILMATGHDDVESIERSYVAGATDFVAKPLNLVILGHRVRYLLRANRERKAAEERVARMALYDELTGLPNRAFLERHLAYVVEHAKRTQRSGAVLSLDLDGFKRVNDTLGHAAGDAILRQVASRLEGCLRASDCVSRKEPGGASNAVARFGGDEFVVVLLDLQSMEDAARVSDRVIRLLSAPFDLDGQSYHIGCSIGIAPYPSDTDDPDVLLANADAAMFEAKRRGAGRFQFYCAEMGRRARESLALETSLRRALDEDQFELHYQPKICTKSGSVEGVEALLRWRHPERGLVSPMEFIPLAERNGLIVPIGDWAIRRACMQARAWSDQGRGELSVAVNVSTRQFRTRELPETVRDALATAGLPAHRLELEITEGSLMEDRREAAAMLNELRAIGVRVAIDDFGTGYSSLSYLRHLPVDTIKVDRSFVRDVTTNAHSAAIATAILAMTRALRLETVAEGVETAEQLEFLVERGCETVQGFLFSRPLPPAELAAWLKTRSLTGSFDSSYELVGPERLRQEVVEHIER
jgi:diguanylate cyclase (GGDEF)-like protein